MHQNTRTYLPKASPQNIESGLREYTTKVGVSLGARYCSSIEGMTL
jgi:hypothetical protein